MLLAALLIPLQGNPPNLDQKVSIDARGVSGKQLTDELSQKTGIRFETRDEATADRYIVHIENAPLKDAMQRIAEAETGEWVRTGRLKYREHIVDGLENAPASFIGVLQGRNFGKMLVRMSA